MTQRFDDILNEQNKLWLDNTYEKLLAKMKAECSRIGNRIPCSIVNGEYVFVNDGTIDNTSEKDTKIGDAKIWTWTNGFWPGMLWQMYSATGDEAYKLAAEGVEEKLAKILEGFEDAEHDMGFVFLPSVIADYRMTGNKIARQRGLKAAQILAGRYNPTGKYIRAWDDHPFLNQIMGVEHHLSGWIIIDCMMNIPMLYWASEETKDPRFYQIAYNHAKTAQQYIVREDGSSNHISIFNSQTGEFVDASGGQGYERGSSWSRGQGWATYGFALSYRHTGDKTFLNTAKQCAHYCIANMAVTGWLPLSDYRAPVQPVKYDTTAGMITACGLLEIAEHVGEHEKRLYIEAAINILKACDEKFSNWDTQKDSIMGGGTWMYNDKTGKSTEVPIVYGDYYFVEAILRLKGNSLFIW